MREIISDSKKTQIDVFNFNQKIVIHKKKRVITSKQNMRYDLTRVHEINIREYV